ncbi:MAG TPA: hypothetical protein VJ180_03515, partial [Pyrinomonadaceae bacterium]|nr:hypothetical protein [Pyrinomonadaceae bacterium]
MIKFAPGEITTAAATGHVLTRVRTSKNEMTRSVIIFLVVPAMKWWADWLTLFICYLLRHRGLDDLSPGDGLQGSRHFAANVGDTALGKLHPALMPVF